MRTFLLIVLLMAIAVQSMLYGYRKGYQRAVQSSSPEQVT